MSFECPYYLDHYCRLQQGACNPAVGKCILKGKAVKAKHLKDNDKKSTE